MSTVTFTIQGRAPMVNRTPAGHIGARREYQARVLDPWYESVAMQARAQCAVKPSGPFYLIIARFDFAWIVSKVPRKDGKPRQPKRDMHARDSDGPVKPFQDAIAKWLGVDDNSETMLTIPFVRNYRQGARENGVAVTIISLPTAPTSAEELRAALAS